MIETALAPYKVGINGITIPILIPLSPNYKVKQMRVRDEDQWSIVNDNHEGKSSKQKLALL